MKKSSSKEIKIAVHGGDRPKLETRQIETDRQPGTQTKQKELPKDGQTLEALGRSRSAPKREQTTLKNAAHHDATKIRPEAKK